MITALQLIDDLRAALNDVGTDELRVLAGLVGGVWKGLTVDADGHLQVDVVSLPDPFEVANLVSKDYVRFATYLRGDKATLTKHYTLMGVKTSGIEDDTYFDIMEFVAGIPTTAQGGVCSGWLTLQVRNRETTAGWQSMTRMYHVSILLKATDGVLTLHQTEVDTDEESKGASAITLTLGSTGGTKSYLKLQAKFTHANWGAYPTAAWQFQGYSHAVSSKGFITPSVV